MTLRNLLVPAALLLTLPLASRAQEEGLLPTQTLLRADSKMNFIPEASAITLELDNKPAPLTSLVPVKSSGVQIALLIDDGLSRNAGVQLGDLKDFINALPPQTELLIGYMRNGTVDVLTPFSTDHATAAAKIRVPIGIPGESASPYFCLSDFVKHWPGVTESGGSPFNKARFVLMVTNGVDLYNGSTSIMNQDSPYVQASITDAERAGVAVSSIYYRDAGIRGGSASFSGQSYLKQVSDATGGEAYYEGLGSPVSLKPFLSDFQHAIAETYIATFAAASNGGGREHLVRLKVTTSTPKLKLRHADEIRPGNSETAQPRP